MVSSSLVVVSLRKSFPRSGSSICSRRPLRSLRRDSSQGFGFVQTKPLIGGLLVAEIQKLISHNFSQQLPGISRPVFVAFHLQLPFDFVRIHRRRVRGRRRTPRSCSRACCSWLSHRIISRAWSPYAREYPLRTGPFEWASGCCSAQRNESRLIADGVDKQCVIRSRCSSAPTDRFEVRRRIAAVGGKLLFGPPIRHARSRAVGQSSHEWSHRQTRAPPNRRLQHR